MMVLRLIGSKVYRQCAGESLALAFPRVDTVISSKKYLEDDATALSSLEHWASKYALALEHHRRKDLETLGEALFDWLDPDNTLESWLNGPEREFEIRVDARSGVLGAALLSLPWELLRTDGAYLAEDRLRLFTIVRRCAEGEARTPAYSDIRLLFMAASPSGVFNLDYEAEEMAILDATAPRLGEEPRVQLDVEESGSLEYLTDKLRLDGPFEALHLSAHSKIISAPGSWQGLHVNSNEQNGTSSRIETALVLETDTGQQNLVSAESLVSALEGAVPSLIFLSACRTANRERSQVSLSSQVGASAARHVLTTCEEAALDDYGVEHLQVFADSYARQLCTRVANVVSWDGSVSDVDATCFAETMYRELADGMTVPKAAALARRALLALHQRDQGQGRHWHLARIYLGPQGGGALCSPHLGQRRPAPTDFEQLFLDKRNWQMPVARKAEFVGRRLAIQQVIRAQRERWGGVLIHGMGNLGKSSLAARIAARLSRLRVVVVCGECVAFAVFEAFSGVVDDITSGLDDFAAAERMRREFEALHLQVIENDNVFDRSLQRLLQHTLKAHPILLILDDLEQSLVEPQAGGHMVVPKPACHSALTGILLAFAKRTSSWLLITSRYDFTVSDRHGQDLTVKLLKRVHLTPMKLHEQRKQWRACVRNDAKQKNIVRLPEELIDSAMRAATGNPGLQSVLMRPMLSGDQPASRASIEAVEAFKQTGVIPPDTTDVGNFFRHMAFDERYRAALCEEERRALSVTTLFDDLAVPFSVIVALLNTADVAKPEQILVRLLALGLLDDWGELEAGSGTMLQSHIAINPLARALSRKLEGVEEAKLAKAAIPKLKQAWQDAHGHFPADQRSVEVLRLILISEGGCESSLDILESVANDAIQYKHRSQQRPTEAHRFATATISLLEHHGIKVGASLLFKAIDVAEALGDVMWQDALLEQALARDDITGLDRAQLFGRRADRLMRLGELNEARRIRELEELPVYEAASELRSVAVTRGQIADILTRQGDLVEARRIRDVEQLPVFEALGEKREIAITRGKIADILVLQGELEEAMRIRKYEQLPIFESIDDKRAIAVARGKIADILVLQGDLIAARKIHEEEQLPILESLGDLREVAVARAKVAEILFRQGEFVESQRIREEEVLPVYEALNDKRGILISQGKIADLYLVQGESEKALTLHLQRLPMALELGAKDALVHIRLSCAKIRLEKLDDEDDDGVQTVINDLSEAFQISVEIQRVEAIAASGTLLGKVLLERGLIDRARIVLTSAAVASDKCGDYENGKLCLQYIEEFSEIGC